MWKFTRRKTKYQIYWRYTVGTFIWFYLKQLDSIKNTEDVLYNLIIKTRFTDLLQLNSILNDWGYNVIKTEFYYIGCSNITPFKTFL